MSRTIKLNRSLFTFGILLLILLLLVLFSKSAIFFTNPNVFSLAITLDLLLTVPFIYCLLIRKTKIPNTTVVPIIILGLIIGTYILPADNQYYLSLFRNWVLPFIEISVLIFITIKVKHGLKKYKDQKQGANDFFTALKETCFEILPQKLVVPFATEIAVMYYGFINWKQVTPNENEFTYHKNSGIPILLAVIIFVIAVETSALHLLIARWSNLAAWILSGLSIYTAIQLFGFLKSLSKRLIAIGDDRLMLRYGILAETEIGFDEIESVELSDGNIKPDKLTKKLSPFSELESPNILIKLHNENTLTGLYGIRKKFKVLALHIDKKEEFKSQMDNALQLSKSKTDK